MDTGLINRCLYFLGFLWLDQVRKLNVSGPWVSHVFRFHGLANPDERSCVLQLRELELVTISCRQMDESLRNK